MSKRNKLHGNKVLSAGLGYTVGNYLLKGISFLTVPIFSRIMSTDDYGVYSIYMTYDAIISVFIAFALHSSLKNAKYRYGKRYDAYVSSILILPVICLTVLLIVVNLFAQSFENLLDLNSVVLNILLCHSFANAIVMIYNGNLGLEYKYQDFIKVSLINTTANVVLSFVLIYTICANEKYMGRILGGAIPLLGVAVFVYCKAFQVEKPRVNLDFWKFGLAYSLPIIPHGLSQIILSSFDRIMIKTVVGNSEAGIYSLGTNVEQLVKITTNSLDTVWGPWFYEKMQKKDYRSIKKYSTYYAYGMFVLLSCLMIAAPEIVKIMGGKSYQEAQYVVIPLLNCTYFTFLYTLPAAIEYYYQKTKMIALGTMGAAFLNVVLNSVCIKRFGYQAAAYTTLASYGAYFLFHYLSAKKIAKMQMFNTKVIVGLILGISVVNIFGLAFVEFFVIRLTVGCLFLMLNAFVIWKYLYPEFKKNDENKGETRKNDA